VTKNTEQTRELGCDWHGYQLESEELKCTQEGGGGWKASDMQLSMCQKDV
jgi:hypothetical protein